MDEVPNSTNAWDVGRKRSRQLNRQNFLTKMNKTSILILGLVTSFCFGFAFKTIIVKQNNSNTAKMKKVTGIGGIFFKCKDPNKIKEWYKTHLGLDTNEYGANFEWRDAEDPTKKGSTAWSPFAATTKYLSKEAVQNLIILLVMMIT